MHSIVMFQGTLFWHCTVCKPFLPWCAECKVQGEQIGICGSCGRKLISFVRMNIWVVIFQGLQTDQGGGGDRSVLWQEHGVGWGPCPPLWSLLLPFFPCKEYQSKEARRTVNNFARIDATPVQHNKLPTDQQSHLLKKSKQFLFYACNQKFH